ncbi:DEAD/DEAH box helicase family protein [Oscillospiraceae bacterium PP1C4]
MNTRWISDIIGQDYETWRPGKIVVISAQTGTGKTSFILNQLLEFATKSKKKILYVCNRSALVEQIQKSLDDLKIPYENNNKKKQMQCLQQQSEPYIKIVSYQKSEFISIQYEIKKFGASYCVFDEAHYFYQDAAFNSGTKKICSYLFTGNLDPIFSSCVNIFMSATDEYVYALLQKIYERDFTTIENYTLFINKAKKTWLKKDIVMKQDLIIVM